ncbi:ubiquilin-like protein [Erinaceus europaeus]|uniref:Ubiquilin-like protein n=1 Tax=Erinaceus europaeus TaxID=9365 RepID=A0A1S3AE70_ERIEU|nr:ubiquilin-like protein [Erinaceus europaeus]
MPDSSCSPSARPLKSMPHVTSRTSRVAHPGRPSDQKNISPSASRVIVKTPGSQEDFMIADDTSVRQFKEKLSAHFQCHIDQLVLVFMGRLLKDQDTLSQRGILDGHTIHLVIKSKHPSRSVIHSSQNSSASEFCHQNRSAKRNSSGVHQPAHVSRTPVEPALSAQLGASQDLEVNSPEYPTQMLENPLIQQLLSNRDVLRQFLSEHPDIQQLIQQNPEVSHILDYSEILWQTLELARNLALIQEIMKIQQPVQNLEYPLSQQSHLGSETIPDGDNAQSYPLFNDQIHSLQDDFGGNIFTALLQGQAPKEAQPSPPSSPTPQGCQDQLPQLPTTRVIYTSSRGLSSITSTNGTTNKVNYSSRTNAAASVSTKAQNHMCAMQQPAEVPALPSTEFTQQSLTEDREATISVNSAEHRSEDDLQLPDEQSSSQIPGNMLQLLLNNPGLVAKMMMFMSMFQLNEQSKQDLQESFLQQTQLSDILMSLANPRASQAISQIEQGLKLLATETPVLLSWVAPYLWGLGWLPAPNWNYPDTVPCAWNESRVAKPKRPQCCHKSATLLQKQQSLAGDPSQLLQAPEIRFSKQMEYLQAMGFGNHQANLQALIATQGDTSAAICKLKRSQGF